MHGTPAKLGASGSMTAMDHSIDAEHWRDVFRRFYERAPAEAAANQSHYYYEQIKRRLSQIIEPNRRVLDIGCGSGDLLAALKPSEGVGVDLNPTVVEEASRRHPNLRFNQMCGEEVHQLNETFDYVLVCQALGEIYDLQTLFRAIRDVCHPGTRVIVVHYSRLWQPALKVADWLRIRTPPPESNWVPVDEVIHLLGLCGFETIRRFGMTPAPLKVPLISNLTNRFFGNLPLAEHLGLNYVIVSRPVGEDVQAAHAPTRVSIVVPARNEEGNIRRIVERLPQLAPEQEVIFVEGGSSDGTWWRIQEVVKSYDGPMTLKYFRQDGHGKGDAVRKGFSESTGDVLMILDADLSVPPEELTKFYDAIASGSGEFINGSRMVYLMDRHAMRFLNLLGNKAFGLIFTWLLSQRFRDTLCGTKVLRRSDYERIAANRAYFGDFDPFGDFDLLFGAARLGLKIVDMPVHYKARTYGDTNISRFRHGWLLLRMCLFAARKIRFA